MQELPEEEKDRVKSVMVIAVLTVKGEEEGKISPAERAKMFQSLWAKSRFEMQIINDYYFNSKFDCDYRTTVFVTFYDSRGIKIDEQKKIPTAPLSSKFDTERKLEMLPGESMTMNFAIPGEAASWKIWVPK